MAMSLSDTGQPSGLAEQIATVNRITALPDILRIVCQSTGLGFAAVARVTADSWTACAVRDEIGFGVAPGTELAIEATICHQVERTGVSIVIDEVSAHPEWCQHHVPKLYGFESYIAVPVVKSDGGIFGTLCALDPRPVKLSGPGTLATFQAFARLVALQLEHEEQLLRSEQLLLDEKETAELREQFIAVIGHDLRTPLNASIGAADLLLGMALPERAQRFAQIVRVSGQRMNRLIDDLLDFARGRLGGGIALHVQPEPELATVLRRVVEELQVAHPGHEIRIDLAIDRVVHCDAARVSQILANLLGNALHHGATQRPVQVTARCEAGQLLLTVGNEGTIPEAVRARLFQPFSRRSGDRSSDGLGLGLYIAQQLALAHGGALSVESGSGTTRFHLQMPAG